MRNDTNNLQFIAYVFNGLKLGNILILPKLPDKVGEFGERKHLIEFTSDFGLHE